LRFASCNKLAFARLIKKIKFILILVVDFVREISIVPQHLTAVSKGKCGVGGMPERLKGADCKSAGYAYVGSNPTPSTTTFIM
jgi:hypothetical protein